jgi:hypothetical protein
VTLTPWHKEVGAAIASAYGVRDFDADRFVCIGDGAGPGEPAVDIHGITQEENSLFEWVDRTRGDSLLVVGWVADAPSGWLPEHAPA